MGEPAVIVRDPEPLRNRARRDIVYVAGVVAIVLWLALQSILMVWLVIRVDQESRRRDEVQICAQHDILEALAGQRRVLGLPSRDIDPPNVEGLNCAALLARPGSS
jgi:hypothetical protein